MRDGIRGQKWKRMDEREDKYERRKKKEEQERESEKKVGVR